MTHRDDFLAIQARVEAQERELDEARSEIELLRAAHARKVRESEQLRRELTALRGHDERLEQAPCTLSAQGARRMFGVLAGMIAGSALLGAAMITIGVHRPMRVRAGARAIPVVERAGTVVAGGGVFDEGTVCTVRTERVDSRPFDCRIEVSCDGRAIYGAEPTQGYVRCGGRDRIRDTRFTRHDGDPRLDYHVRSGRVIVEEQLGLGTQVVEIELATEAAPGAGR